MASDSYRYRYGETSPSAAVIATSQQANVGDLVAYNSSTITRAEDQAWNSTLSQTQTDFVAKFLGVSAQRKNANQTQPGTGGGPAGFVRVDTGGVFEFACASATFNVGDLVGCAKDTGNALLSQTVRPDGIDLNFQVLSVEETFFRMLRNREFDAAELSMSSYCVTLGRDNPDFIAIPVFPSRFFRHSCIFVSAKSGIEKPSDLVGKRIGVPEYQMTAPVWIRGILQDEYGIDPASVTYVTGGEEEPGREEKLKLNLPDKFKVEPIGPNQTLTRMLADGEIDALHTARAPSTFYSEPHNVRRLFPDFVQVEKAYFGKTNIFPIMHVVAIRRDIYEKNRWIAQALYKAFVQAQQLTYEQLRVSASLKTMLPWQIAAVEETIATLGDQWWPYGIEKNRHVLETFTRYHHEQGLSPRQLTIEDMFAPETFAEFKI
ncbi:MAG: ABC transporter substrate-binding protein [Parvibaculum sp.]